MTDDKKKQFILKSVECLRQQVKGAPSHELHRECERLTEEIGWDQMPFDERWQLNDEIMQKVYESQ